MAGFEKRFMVTGQTYPRKVDYNILAGIGGLGATIHKVCTVTEIFIVFIRQQSDDFSLRRIDYNYCEMSFFF